MSKSKHCNANMVVESQEDLDKTIKRFMRKVKKSGILQEVRDRARYTKKSELRHAHKMKIRFYREKTKKELSRGKKNN